MVGDMSVRYLYKALSLVGLSDFHYVMYFFLNCFTFKNVADLIGVAFFLPRAK